MEKALEEKAGGARCFVDMRDGAMRVKSTQITNDGAAAAGAFFGARLVVKQLDDDEVKRRIEHGKDMTCIEDELAPAKALASDAMLQEPGFRKAVFDAQLRPSKRLER